jgi:hypothetical protein
MNESPGSLPRRYPGAEAKAILEMESPSLRTVHYWESHVGSVPRTVFIDAIKVLAPCETLGRRNCDIDRA